MVREKVAKTINGYVHCRLYFIPNFWIPPIHSLAWITKISCGVATWEYSPATTNLGDTPPQNVPSWASPASPPTCQALVASCVIKSAIHNPTGSTLWIGAKLAWTNPLDNCPSTCSTLSDWIAGKESFRGIVQNDSAICWTGNLWGFTTGWYTNEWMWFYYRSNEA